MLSTLQPHIIPKEPQPEIMEQEIQEEYVNVSIEDDYDKKMNEASVNGTSVVVEGKRFAVEDHNNSVRHEKRAREEENIVIEENSVTATVDNPIVEEILPVSVSKKSKLSVGNGEEEELDVDAVDEENDDFSRAQQQQQQVEGISVEGLGTVSLGAQEPSEEEEKLQQESEDVEIDDDVPVQTVISSLNENAETKIAGPTLVSNKETANGWASLSSELLYQVFSFQLFDTRDLHSSIRVCKEWKSSLDTPASWGQALRHSWKLYAPLKGLEFKSNEYNWKELAKKYFLFQKECSKDHLANQINAAYDTMGSLISRRVPGSLGPFEELAKQLATIQQLSIIQKIMESFEKSVSVPMSLSPSPYVEELVFVINNTFVKGPTEISILSKTGEEIHLISQTSNSIYQLSFFEPLSNTQRPIFQFSADPSTDHNLASLKKVLQLTHLAESTLLFYLWKCCLPMCNFTEDKAKQFCERYHWDLKSMDIFQEQQQLLGENQSGIGVELPVTTSLSITNTENSEEPEEDIDIL